MKKYDVNKVDDNLHMNDDGFCWLIVTDKAKEIYNSGLFQLFVVYPDDTESAIEDYETLDKALANGEMIGIEVGHSKDGRPKEVENLSRYICEDDERYESTLEAYKLLLEQAEIDGDVWADDVVTMWEKLEFRFTVNDLLDLL